MITSFNPENKVQFEMYSHLFKKAYNDLLEKGKLTEEEIKLGRFTSLDNYFAHMADLFAINPPSQSHVLAGATVVVNLYAGGEMVAAGEYRKNAVMANSKRLAAGYVFSSAGEGESTQDLVFFGHKMIAENGYMLEEAYDFV